jgi:hypothetical protein
MNFAEFAEQECPELYSSDPVAEIGMDQIRAELGDDPDWRRVEGDPEILRLYAEALKDSRTRRQGDCPADYQAVSECAECGPVFLPAGFPAQVAGCPWCLNRAQGLPIPRPIKHHTQAVTA